MKKKLTILAMVLLSTIAYAQTDSLNYVQIQAMQQNIATLQKSVSDLKQADNQISGSVNSAKAEISALSGQLSSTQEKVAQNAENIRTTADELGIQIKETNDNANTIDNSLRSKTIWGICLFVVLLIISVVIYLLLRKRISKGDSAIAEINKAQAALQNAQKSLEEESVKLDGKMVDILEKQMAVQTVAPATAEPDHSLALKIAGEITRIENNLSKMDQSIRGYKQLKSSVDRIKDNFTANGYELVDMLGKNYNEGMRVNADFLVDEELPEGARIITKVSIPQVNYKGSMIQKATITISQNI